MKVLNRPVPIGQATQTQNSSAVQLMSAPGVKSTPTSPDRLQSVEAEIASVCCLGDTHNRDAITCMIHAVLNDNKDMNPDDSIVVKMKLYINSPEEFSGSSNL